MSEKTRTSTYLVPRSNGEIVPMNAIKTLTDFNGTPKEVEVARKRDDGLGYDVKDIRGDALTDSGQHRLAEELAKSSPTYESRMREKFTPEQLKVLGIKVGHEAARFTLGESYENSPLSPASQIERDGIVSRVPGFSSEAAPASKIINTVAEKPNLPVEDTLPRPPSLKDQQRKANEISIQNQLDALTQGLSPDDLLILRHYAGQSEDKFDAQAVGDGAASIRAQQYMGQYYKDLSPAAQKVASAYASLWRRRT